MVIESSETTKYRTFYEREYEGSRYAKALNPEEHGFYETLRKLIRKYDLQSKRCLEIGAGRGALQNMVQNYFGVDLSRAAGKNFKKPFFHASATELPFKDNSFDVIWTYAVLEHIPRPENALKEMRRVLKPGGILLLHAAWYCRSWAADGYPVRPYSDFNWKGKLIKASIPIRNNVIFRSMLVFPRRAIKTFEYKIKKSKVELSFRKLKPNYEKFWMSDSDALSSIDPYDVVMWFESRGDQCISHLDSLKKFMIRTGVFIVQIGDSDKNI